METTPTIIDSTSLVVPEKFNIENQEVNKELLRARIAEDTFKPLCTDINDTKGYKALVAKRAEYRTLRTSLEKHRKDIVKPLQTYMTDLKDATDELGEIAYEGEQFFDDAIKNIDAEKLRLKREEEERKAQALQARIADINALGAIYHNGTYTLPYDESKSVTATQIATLSDTGFEELLDEMKEAFANEQTRLHEERLKEEAERKRQAKIANENQRREAELKEIVAKLRIKQLQILGGKDSGDEYIFTNGIQQHNVNIADVLQMESEDWDALINTVELFMQPKTQFTIDADVRGQITEDRIEQIKALGFYNDADHEGVYRHANNSILSDDDIWNATENEWNDIIQEQKDFASSIPSGNPVDMPDESYMANHRVEAAHTMFKIEEIEFDRQSPYFDFERSAKEIIRLYPDEYAEIALSGCKVVKQGKVQGLNIAIIKK
jgi:hypothetical protein